MTMDQAEMIERLAAFIRGQGKFDRVTIENLKRMPGGASREIWSFEAVMELNGATTRQALVLRRDPGAHRIQTTSRRHEFLVLRAAYEEGVPVPGVLWEAEDPAVLGAPFFLWLLARDRGSWS